MSDRLQHLGILKRLRSSELAGQLDSLQRASATNALMTAQVAEWMTVNGFLPEPPAG